MMFLTPEQKIQIQESVDRFYAKAVKLLKADPNAKQIKVTYNVRGRVGGKASIQKRAVLVNEQLAYENFDDYLINTIGHEVAHIVAYQLCGLRIKPHGYEWKGVMRILGLDPVRCHNYNTARSKRGGLGSYIYKCKCSKRTYRYYEKQHNEMQFREHLPTCWHCNAKTAFHAFESVNVCFLMREKK